MSNYEWRFLFNAAFFMVWAVLCANAMKLRAYDMVVLYALFAIGSIASMTVYLYLLAK